MPATELPTVADRAPGCVFYGCHTNRTLRLLIDSDGNQCAVITDAYSPCRMELEGKTPDWETCPRNKGGKRPFEGFTKVQL